MGPKKALKHRLSNDTEREFGGTLGKLEPYREV